MHWTLIFRASDPWRWDEKQPGALLHRVVGMLMGFFVFIKSVIGDGYDHQGEEC